MEFNGGMVIILGIIIGGFVGNLYIFEYFCGGFVVWGFGKGLVNIWVLVGKFVMDSLVLLVSCGEFFFFLIFLIFYFILMVGLF